MQGCVPAGVSAACWLGSSTASSTTLMLWLCITSCSMLKISSAREHLKAKIPEKHTKQQYKCQQTAKIRAEKTHTHTNTPFKLQTQSSLCLIKNRKTDWEEVELCANWSVDRKLLLMCKWKIYPSKI